MTKQFAGVIPPALTPLTAERAFDRDSFARNLDRMIAAGVNGLFVLGSTGEAVFLTNAQRREVLATAVEVAAGRVPVLAGVIEMQPNRVLDCVAAAEEVGVDAVVATAPFYALGGPAQVERHYRVLAASTNLPIFAYDIPVCVHVKLPGDLLLRLGQDGVLAGVKDSSGDDVSFRWLAAANRAAGSPLTLLTGHEVVVDGAYLSGADGSVPGLANVDPLGYVRQWQAYQAGDWEAVRAEQDRLAELMRIVTVSRGAVGYGAGVGAFKTALRELGVIATNQMSEPVEALGPQDAAAIRGILAGAGLLDAGVGAGAAEAEAAEAAVAEAGAGVGAGDVAGQ